MTEGSVTMTIYTCLQRWRWLAAMALGVDIGCTVADTGPAPTPMVEPSAAAPMAEPSAALERAQAFQTDYDRELREDDHSFLTVVAAYYLAPGDQLELALVDGAWAPSDAPQLRFEATPEQLRIHGMPGVDEPDIREATLIPFANDDRFAFAMSPQSESWRVQIHDRDAELRASFPGVAWFPLDGAAIVDARFEAAPTREATVLQTSRGLSKTLYVVGHAHFELGGQSLSLQAFGYAPDPSPDEPLLIPFRDETSGHRSYAAGRYLELSAPANGQLQLDFNRATNPLCAYSEHFNCPVPPRFNTLGVAIQAGAMAPQGHH